MRTWCRQPDSYERPCDGWQRLLTPDLVQRLREGVERSGGKKEWIVGFADPYVYLNAEAKKLPPPKYQKLIEIIRSTSEKINGIMTAKEVPTSKQDCGNQEDDSVDALLCRSMVVGALGSVYLVPKPGFFFDPEYVPGHGSNHGTPYVYDRTVPILVRAPGRAQPNLEKHEPMSFGTFLRTANAVLNLRSPDESIGGVALIHLFFWARRPYVVVTNAPANQVCNQHGAGVIIRPLRFHSNNRGQQLFTSSQLAAASIQSTASF